MSKNSLFARLSTWPPPRGPRLVTEGLSWTVCIAYAVSEVFDLFGEQLRQYFGDAAVAILAIVLVWSRVQIMRAPQADKDQLAEQLEHIRESVSDLADLVAPPLPSDPPTGVGTDSIKP